jgi:hypothetical protein
VNIFFDVDGVLIHSYRGDRSRQETWDHDIEADLGVPRNAFQTALFGTQEGDEEPVFHSVLRGERPLEEALAVILPQIRADVEASTLIAYWLEQDSSINEELFPSSTNYAMSPTSVFFWQRPRSTIALNIFGTAWIFVAISGKCIMPQT